MPADEVSKTYKTVTKRYQKLARIPGFRAGKVPESLIKSKFAKEVAPGGAGGTGVGAVPQGDRGAKLRPVSEPQLLDLQLNDGQPLKFKAAFEVLPEFDIAGLRQRARAEADGRLTDEEFEAELDARAGQPRDR